MEDYTDNKCNLCEIEVKYNPKFKVSELPKICTSSDSAAYVRSVIPNIEYREYFYILCLNRNNRALGYNQISMGGMMGTVVDVRFIFQIALKTNACSIILCHNHPSGNPMPSEADKDMTRKIREAGKMLDLPVLDHIILTPESYFSFADEGLL